MPETLLERAVAESRVQTAAALRESLKLAPVSVLQKLAIDLVPPLFRIDYHGEPRASGARWADAIALPKLQGLPRYLVRVYRGPFTADEAEDIVETMKTVQVGQTALALVSEDPIPADLRERYFGIITWMLDIDGLTNLMINANVGVTSRVYETKYVDSGYFR